MQLYLEDCGVDLAIGQNIPQRLTSNVGDTYVLHEAFRVEFLHRFPGLLIWDLILLQLWILSTWIKEPFRWVSSLNRYVLQWNWKMDEI